MAIIFLFLASLPAGIGALITGDFTQLVFKPSRDQVYFTLRHRSKLIAASALFWLAGLTFHIVSNPTTTLAIITSGVLALGLNLMGFIMPAYILFSGVRNPIWLSADEAEAVLAPDDRVIGIEINGDARALPIKWMHRPHIVSDTVGGEPITITYCLLSNSAMAVRSSRNGEHVNYITPLQWENNMLLYDPEEQTLIQQIGSKILYGPETGKKLDQCPTRILPWSTWRKFHPTTKALKHPPVHLFDHLVRKITGNLLMMNRLQEAPIFPIIVFRIRRRF